MLVADLGRGAGEDEEDDSYEEDSEDEEAAKTLALCKKAGLTGTDLGPAKSGRTDSRTPEREKEI